MKKRRIGMGISSPIIDEMISHSTPILARKKTFVYTIKLTLLIVDRA